MIEIERERERERYCKVRKCWKLFAPDKAKFFFILFLQFTTFILNFSSDLDFYNLTINVPIKILILDISYLGFEAFQINYFFQIQVRNFWIYEVFLQTILHFMKIRAPHSGLILKLNYGFDLRTVPDSPGSCWRTAPGSPGSSWRTVPSS